MEGWRKLKLTDEARARIKRDHDAWMEHEATIQREREAEAARQLQSDIEGAIDLLESQGYLVEKDNE